MSALEKSMSHIFHIYACYYNYNNIVPTMHAPKSMAWYCDVTYRNFEIIWMNAANNYFIIQRFYLLAWFSSDRIEINITFLNEMCCFKYIFKQHIAGRSNKIYKTYVLYLKEPKDFIEIVSKSFWRNITMRTFQCKPLLAIAAI